MISSQQNFLYTVLMSAGVTDRIVENEFKVRNKANAYTLSEHFATLLGSVFGDVGAVKSMKPLRRDLQRYAINALTIQSGAPAGGVSEDVRMLASDALVRLSKKFGQHVGDAGLDDLTRVHYRNAKENIDRFLSRVNVGR
jgi:hypothetical protein